MMVAPLSQRENQSSFYMDNSYVLSKLLLSISCLCCVMHIVRKCFSYTVWVPCRYLRTPIEDIVLTMAVDLKSEKYQNFICYMSYYIEKETQSFGTVSNSSMAFSSLCP